MTDDQKDNLTANSNTENPSPDEPTSASTLDPAAGDGGEQNAPEAATTAAPSKRADTPVGGTPELDLSWMGFDPTAEGDIDAALAAVSSLGASGTREAQTGDSADEYTDDAYADDEYADEGDYDDEDEAYAGEDARLPVMPVGAAEVSTAGDLSRRADADLRADAGLREGKNAPDRYIPKMAIPPANTSLKRGSLGSLVPALVLIGVGAWLTLVTTSGGSVDGGLLAAIGVGGAALSLFGFWVSTGRWSRGALFFAAFVALAAGLLIFALVPDESPINFGLGIDLTRAYPLFVAAIGLAAVISGLLGRKNAPNSRRPIGPGVVLLAAGVVGLLVTIGIIPASVLQFAAPLWFVPIVVLLILWLLPLVFRLRENEQRQRRR